MGNCNCHSEINLAGSGQLERYLKALDPAYISIDGRSTEDLLVYASKYADQVRFYDMPDSSLTERYPAKISWAEFFQRDMAVIAASIATVDLVKIKSDYDEASNQILVTPSVALYKSLFEQIAAIVIRIDQWFAKAIPENPLYADINLAINSNLSAQLKKALSYEEGFIIVDSKTVLDIDYSKLLNQEEWGLNNAVDPDFDIYQGITPAEKITNAVPYVDDVFHAFYGAIAAIVDQAPNYLSFALTQYPGHQPYMALFITFVELFTVAQQQMNGLTAQMLDFYYNDVLHLAKKPSVPDKVYVIFQLAQNVATYDLGAGTALSAGKDDSGKDMVYKTEKDFVINQANVKELKSIFIDKKYTVSGNIITDTQINSIFSDPVANSQDGYGAKFNTLGAKWPTFGTGAVAALPDKPNICDYIAWKEADLNSKNKTAIGFAIASPQLVLQGGNRLVKIVIDSTSNPHLDNVFNSCELSLTGEKGWLNIKTSGGITKAWADKVLGGGRFDSAPPTTDFTYANGVLYIYLPMSEQGIVGFNTKTHTGYSFGTTYPVIEVLLGPDIGLPANLINNLKVDDLSIAIRVGSFGVDPKASKDPSTSSANFDGLKKLIIQNDISIIAPGKQFDPFTNLPYYNASFYIGSDEVFNKPLGALAIDVQLTAGDPSSQNKQNNKIYGLSVRENQRWMSLADNNSPLSPDDLKANVLRGADNNLKKALADRSPIDYHSGYDDSNTDKGFLKIDYVPKPDLNSGVVSFRADPIQERLALAPFLQIKELSISYHSELTSLDPEIDQVFHIYPFGATPISYDNTTAKNPLAVLAQNKLLPQFTFLSPVSQYQNVKITNKLNGTANSDVSANDDPLVGLLKGNSLNQLIYDVSSLSDVNSGLINQYSADNQEEGMLFIGLEKLQPLQSLSLLFEFADGSAADEDDTPPAINWSYLVFNKWSPLKSENIMSDSTYGFQTTGIVNISVPADINDKHTIVTDGLYWFCASVTTYSDRIPQLIGVVTQATEVRFFDQGNSQSHYDTPLPAGSVTKLSVAVSQVSKVLQPYASFDGKHAEVGKEYYTRVSERLRHKGRAITTWDYEHLVLDRFPQVFKVKCIPNINPDCLCPKPSKKPVPEKCCGPVPTPGHVLIIPVPNLKNDNALNPLQPKTSRLTLIEIVNYLTPLTSPFVTVHSKNPIYEQVIVFFRVKFINDVDKGYYLRQLNDEIVKYLTPWAFDATIEADFGQKIYASAIITFIEQRPYVDFITDFLMGICRHDCCPPEKKTSQGSLSEADLVAALNNISGCDDIGCFLKEQGYFIGEVIAEPSTQMSLLVSAPKHIILLYEDPPPAQTACDKRLAALAKNSLMPAHVSAEIMLPDSQPPAITENAGDTQDEVVPHPEESGAENANTPGTVSSDLVVAEEKPNVIEETIEDFDKIILDQANKIAVKGKAAFKKAEDFVRRVVKGDESAKSPDTGSLPDIKMIPPPSDNPADGDKQGG